MDTDDPRKELHTETYTGKKFYPFNPCVDQVSLEDIAHALSLQCRFGGHCSAFYSVAQHSVLVSEMADTLLSLDPHKFVLVALWGLLHDAAEAYFIDVPRPVKLGIAEYQAIEKPIQDVIMDFAGLPRECPLCIKTFDEIALATEARDLMPSRGVWWQLPYAPLPQCIYPVSSTQAEKNFLNRYKFILSNKPKE